MNSQLPRSRKNGLTVQNVENDVLIYDSVNVKAHSLNRTAALVWKYADGKRSLSEIARLVGKELGSPVKVETVEYALAQLDKSGLLESNAAAPAWSNLTRREFMKAATTAAILVPVVKTIRIPGPAQGSSCLGDFALCKSSDECCSGICCIWGDFNHGPPFPPLACVPAQGACGG